MDFSGEVANGSEMSEGKQETAAVCGYGSIRSSRWKIILDVGCGGGHLVRELGNAAGTEGRVVGIDSSPQMLENAKAVCQGLACVKIIEGNAAQIPSDDAQFDGLAAISV